MGIWIFVGSFFLILSLIIFINYKINHDFKIETSWLALSLSPVVVWLLTTEQLAEFSGFGLAFKLKEATSTPVSLEMDGDLIKPEAISRDEKSDMSHLDDFKRDRVSAVTLVVGKQGYYSNWGVELYLSELTPLSFFKYVIFEDKAGNFKGMIWGTRLLEEMRTSGIDLVSILESGQVPDIRGVSTNPVLLGSSKQESLQIMDAAGLSELPVVNESNAFVGVVERDKITSSIVAQLVSASISED